MIQIWRISFFMNSFKAGLSYVECESVALASLEVTYISSDL